MTQEYGFADTLEGLLKQRDEAVAELIEFKNKPMYIQAEFGNALEARIGTLSILIDKVTHRHNFVNRVCVECDETFANAVKETAAKLVA